MSEDIQLAPTDLHKPDSTLRERVAAKISEITTKAGEVLAELGIVYPLFFLIPNSGDSMLTFGTSQDPSDQEWQMVSSSVAKIVQEALGTGPLRTREIVCTQTKVTSQEADDETL